MNRALACVGTAEGTATQAPSCPSGDPRWAEGLSSGARALVCAGLRHRSRRPRLVFPSWQQGAPRDLLMGATAALAGDDRNQASPGAGVAAEVKGPQVGRPGPAFLHSWQSSAAWPLSLPG